MNNDLLKLIQDTKDSMINGFSKMIIIFYRLCVFWFDDPFLGFL